jgi:hypothetical protein
MSYSVAHKVGRLVEVRIEGRPEDPNAFLHELVRVIGGVAGRIVVATDLRKMAKAANPDEIDSIASFMRGENPRVERNALLLPGESATVQMQIERMVKSAGSESRRLFRVRGAAEAWLAEILNAEERARLAAFLDAGELAPG